MVADTRDQRDPTKLGGSILHNLSRWDGLTKATEAHDMIEEQGIAIPNYAAGESTATITKREYRQELEARAAKGDKFAISMLTTGKPGDSDE